MRFKATPSVLVLAALLTTALWGQTSAQSGADANGQASVQTDKTSAQASGGASVGAAADSNRANAELTSGTTFNAALVTALDSKKVKSGDQVVARTTEKVKNQGKTVLPSSTKLIGHITQASARAKGDSESALGIAFDRAILKGGQEMPVNVRVQALASSANAVSSGREDADAMASTGGGRGAGDATPQGPVGSATSNLGGAVGSTTNTAERTARVGQAEVNSTLNSTKAAGGIQAVGGLNASGQLTPDSRGVFNLSGVTLDSTITGARGSVITSRGKNVHLDSGTRMLLAVQTGSSRSNYFPSQK